MPDIRLFDDDVSTPVIAEMGGVIVRGGPLCHRIQTAWHRGKRSQLSSVEMFLVLEQIANIFYILRLR